MKEYVFSTESPNITCTITVKTSKEFGEQEQSGIRNEILKDVHKFQIAIEEWESENGS